MARWALGSVTEQIVENAPCAIDVIRPAGPQPLFTQKKILFCVDGSVNSDEALEWLCNSTWTDDQEFVFLTVLAPMLESLLDAMRKGSQRRKVETILECAYEMLSLEGGSVESPQTIQFN